MDTSEAVNNVSSSEMILSGVKCMYRHMRMADMNRYFYVCWLQYGLHEVGNFVVLTSSYITYVFFGDDLVCLLYYVYIHIS